MIRLIIFDWDDVFTLGSKEGYFSCYQKTLEELGVTLTRDEQRHRILANWGTACPVVVKALLKEKPKLVARGQKIFNKHLLGSTFIDHISILPEVVPLLNRLSKKYRLCIATGLHPLLLKKKIMSKFGIPNVFAQIISSYDFKDTKKQKPSPFMVKLILKKENVHPNEAILVGDAKGDVLMAQNADVTPVVVLSGHLNVKDAESLGVKYIIKDVTSIEEILLKLNSQII